MNEPLPDANEGVPTPEQLVGRQLRLLRQSRSWSQLEVAEKMRAYGYKWSQATVTRLEAATRPIRLNELIDLAALYDVPFTQLLESGAPEDLEALRHETGELTHRRAGLKKLLAIAEADAAVATEKAANLGVRLARVEGRLETLMRWQPNPGESGDDR